MVSHTENETTNEVLTAFWGYTVLVGPTTCGKITQVRIVLSVR
jgi:hypothetical protein